MRISQFCLDEKNKDVEREKRKVNFLNLHLIRSLTKAL